MLKSILVSIIIIGALIAAPNSTAPATTTKDVKAGQVDTDNIGQVKIEKLGTDAIPQKMNLQGYLTTAAGDTFSGNRSIQFKIYRGGSEIWQETQSVVITKSLFSVILGTVTPITSSIFQPGTSCELELIVAGQTLSPRIEITSVGYAFKSVRSDTASYAVNAYLNRPITPPINSNEIAKPCTLKASVSGTVLEVKNTHASGTGIGVDSAGWVGVGVNRVGAAGYWVGTSGWAGLDIDSVAYDGVYINRAGNYGINVRRAGVNGVIVDSAGDAGFVVNRAGGSGFAALRPRWTGFYVDSAQTGVHIPNVYENGVHVNRAGRNGIYVDSAQNGVYVDTVTSNGFFVERASSGLQVNFAGYAGVQITHAGQLGLFIVDVSGEAIRIDNAGGNGVAVYDAGRAGIVSYQDTLPGNFYHVSSQGSSSGNWGLCAHSYQNNSGYGAIRAFGYGYASGGWGSELKGKKDGAPCIVGLERTIVIYGTTKLSNGKAEINYPETFIKNIRSDMPISLNITPNDDPAGVIFTKKNGIYGFSVTLKEIPGWSGDKDINFDWVAIGTLQEPETTPEAKAEWENAMREREERRASNEKVMKVTEEKR